MCFGQGSLLSLSASSLDLAYPGFHRLRVIADFQVLRL